MKRNTIGIISILLLGLAVSTGCQKRVSTEDFGAKSETGETAAQAPQAAENKPAVVPEDKTRSENVTAEDIKNTADAKLGGTYASLAPGGDDLTKKATEKGQLFTVYFDYDKYAIRDSELDKLTQNAKWLGLNSKIKIRIEGNADERGETEYNLALGDKRARSVKKYLQDMGISVDRIDTVSYGEEKPAVPGHDESAWAKNRRAEFVITAN